MQTMFCDIIIISTLDTVLCATFTSSCLSSIVWNSKKSASFLCQNFNTSSLTAPLFLKYLQIKFKFHYFFIQIYPLSVTDRQTEARQTDIPDSDSFT